MPFRRALVCGALFSACLLVGRARAQNETFTEPKSGKTFPQKTVFTFEGKEFTLLATGAIQAVKESKKAKETGGENPRYTMAHYLEATARDSAQSLYDVILTKPVVKQMTFVYDFSVDADQSRKIYSRFFSHAFSPAELEQNKSAIEDFLNAMSLDLSAQQSLSLRWLPDNRMVIIRPDETEKILGPSPLAALFWKSWFGETSQIDRAGLVEKLAAH